MSDKQQNAPSGADPSPAQAVLQKFNTDNAVVRQQAFNEFGARNAQIQSIGKQFADFGAKELADAAVVDPNMTVDAFREAVLELVGKKSSAPTRTGQLERDRIERGGDAPAFGMGARDMLHGLQARSFEGIGKLLKMSDQEAAFRAGMFLKGVLFGNADAIRWCNDAGMELRQGRLDGAAFAGESVGTRALSGGVFTSAGWLMPAELSTAIIINREQYGVARRICNMIPMSTNTLAIPRVTNGVTAYFVGEGTQGTTSDPSGDQVNLTLKDLMCTTAYGNSTAQDSAIPLADMITREQARARAVKEDACLIIGDGTSTYGGMMGIRTLLNTAAYSAGVAAAASTHDTFAEVDNADIASLLGQLPVYARAGARFVCSGVFDATVFARLKLIAGGNTVQTVQGAVVEGSYAGFPITIAHDMPNSATNGNVMVIFGNLELGVAFGYGQAMMMTVDPYSRARYNQTEVTTVERIDINPHGVIKSTTAGQQGPIVGLDATT